MSLVFLTGAPASGKTTLGRKLAGCLHRQGCDLDQAIAEEAGCSIPDIFAAEGEAGFRRRESERLAESVRALPDGSIVALGGGTLLCAGNRALCESSGAILCLETPGADELARRLGAAAGSRPLGDRAAERAEHYASFPRRISASFEAGNSLVVIGRGIAPAIVSGEMPVLDGRVAELHGADFPPPVALVPPGEEHKTPETVRRLWSAFARRRIGRRDRVTAVGGGVTGDLTGFAAATWMRGIDWINVPTTLLAMVDASTGGKTGCDLPEGKNLAGAFHPPRLVVIDVDFLQTLPPGVLAAGRAEMIKHEIIGGLPHDAAPVGIPTAQEIAANLRVKVGIVREDPFERTGRRILLNCGHTVAHAVERETDFAVPHGEAVAIGCVEEARIAVRRGLAPEAWPDELAARFRAAGLPTTLPEGLSLPSLREAMLGDKKGADGSVTFALPCGWGDVRAVAIPLSAGASL
ncbi:MAG: bifunctional shikimate kinase/3-dehydroquinate synthase [Kiritimatiellia bacterium]|jgi:shikimate kinase/3-dehydroquinate synthase